MPRQNDGGEIVRKLTFIDLYRVASGTIGDTVSTAPVVKGATSIPISAITNFTVADPALFIGDGGMEIITAIGTPNATQTITNQVIEFAQSTGARFVEAVRVALGKIEAGGFQYSMSRSQTAIESAQDDSPIAFEDGTLELSGGFGLLGFNPENFQLIAGLAESISGTGATATPWQAAIGAVNQTLLSNIAFRVGFLRQDGKTGHYDLLGARVSASGGVQVGKGGNKAYQCNINFTQSIKRVYA